MMESGTVLPSRPLVDLSDYECPICTEYLWPPIYKCPNGHPFCKECSNKVRICGICREYLPFPKSRDIHLEIIVIRGIFPCEFSTTGCLAKVRLCNMEQHTKICKFRTGRHCATLGFPNCPTIVSFSRLMDHAQTTHGIPCISVDLNQECFIEQIIRPENAENFTRVDWKSVFIFLKGANSIFQLRTGFDSDIIADDGKIRWTIQDSFSSGGDYIAIISLIKHPSQRYCTTWMGPILKPNDDLDDLYSWFVLPSKFLTAFSSWKLKICIKPGTWGSRDAGPTCISINEIQDESEQVQRPAASTADRNPHLQQRVTPNRNPQGTEAVQNHNPPKTLLPNPSEPNIATEPILADSVLFKVMLVGMSLLVYAICFPKAAWATFLLILVSFLFVRFLILLCEAADLLHAFVRWIWN